MTNDKELKNASNDEQDNQDENDKADKKENKEKTKKGKLTRVIFNKSHTPYIKGEMAGIEPDLAEKLIESKICSKA